MKRTLIGLAVLLSAANANAATVTFENLAAEWKVPATSTFDVNDFVGNTPTVTADGVAQLRWGSPATNFGPSGYDFDPTNTAFEVDADDTPFQLGTFTHLNRPIWSSSDIPDVVELVLSGDLSLSGGNSQGFSFSYLFSHEETPNNAHPCAYSQTDDVLTAPSGSVNQAGCADRVSILQPTPENTLFIDIEQAVSVTLILDGFAESGTTAPFYSAFLSGEHANNSADLFGRFQVLSDDPKIGDPIPLPATAWLLITAVGGYVGARRMTRN